MQTTVLFDMMQSKELRTLLTPWSQVRHICNSNLGHHYCQLGPKEHISMKFYLQFKDCHSRNCIWNVVCKMVAIFSQPQPVNALSYFVVVWYHLILPIILVHFTGQTSNGSWCMGIKGEMSGTVCVTCTWYMYIYGLFIAFVCFVVCSLL